MPKNEMKCSIVFCDSIQMIPGANGQQTPSIITPLAVLTPYHVPGNYSFAISCTIIGINPEISNTIYFRFYNTETDSEVIKNNIVIEPNSIKFNQPCNAPYAVFGFNIDARNIIFKDTGTFAAVICINGEEIGRESIDVFSVEK